MLAVVMIHGIDLRWPTSLVYCASDGWPHTVAVHDEWRRYGEGARCMCARRGYLFVLGCQGWSPKSLIRYPVLVGTAWLAAVHLP
eukprot:scaffold249382_cov30-Tisochrysis_lutea.AAC.1